MLGVLCPVGIQDWLVPLVRIREHCVHIALHERTTAGEQGVSEGTNGGIQVEPVMHCVLSPVGIQQCVQHWLVPLVCIRGHCVHITLHAPPYRTAAPPPSWPHTHTLPFKLYACLPLPWQSSSECWGPQACELWTPGLMVPAPVAGAAALTFPVSPPEEEAFLTSPDSAAGEGASPTFPSLQQGRGRFSPLLFCSTGGSVSHLS